uniref:Uncharacterized protein n=1 Tax=Triticum urartu TaxID=4572 RepID=A0A8R7QD63_TRIUA
MRGAARRCNGARAAAMMSMEIGRWGLCNSGDAALKLFGSTVGVAMEQHGAVGSRDGTAMKPRRSCNGASSDASVLHWSSAGAAMELCRTRRRCVGARPVLLLL